MMIFLLITLFAVPIPGDCCGGHGHAVGENTRSFLNGLGPWFKTLASFSAGVVTGGGLYSLMSSEHNHSHPDGNLPSPNGTSDTKSSKTATVPKAFIQGAPTIPHKTADGMELHTVNSHHH
eukprot:NODE_83_length_22684_cov_0.307934.p15 type:complete len:121 gc:universal NODE_83_length_22684_cov_0.307934:11197-10835(-)